jgi:heme O synthase-like polyprenyltransferase
MAALFTAITVAFGLIAVWSGSAGEWVIAATAVALSAWMGTLAWTALRKTRGNS